MVPPFFVDPSSNLNLQWFAIQHFSKWYIFIFYPAEKWTPNWTRPKRCKGHCHFFTGYADRASRGRLLQPSGYALYARGTQAEHCLSLFKQSHGQFGGGRPIIFLFRIEWFGDAQISSFVLHQGCFVKTVSGYPIGSSTVSHGVKWDLLGPVNMCVCVCWFSFVHTTNVSIAKRTHERSAASTLLFPSEINTCVRGSSFSNYTRFSAQQAVPREGNTRCSGRENLDRLFSTKFHRPYGLPVLLSWLTAPECVGLVCFLFAYRQNFSWTK